MEKLEELSRLMKADWDRRVNHDYRFWMSDGWSSDDVMWQTGERDLAIILDGVEDTGSKSFLEVGCGVGRLLRAAGNRFAHATGIDVSEKAIDKAKELLADKDNVSCVCGNGVDLSEVADGSIDCLISFAALTSMPTDVIACYLREMHRVLKDDGVVRLQVYLGKEQLVRENDTLHLRCYRRESFTDAMEKAGFSVDWIKELELPFQVSFKEVGIEAVVVSLHKSSHAPGDAAEISKVLLPDGEVRNADGGDGEALEYWMSVNYAKELAAQGDIDKAKDALQYAEVVTRTMSIDVQDSLETLVNRLEKESVDIADTSRVTGERGSVAGDAYERNLRCLRDRFPAIARLVESHQLSAEVATADTSDGPVILYDGQCLDHMSKPRAAAQNWCKQWLQNTKIQEAEAVVVYGFASGYHIEELFDSCDKPLGVIEPSLDVFVQALRQRDLTAVLSRIASLSVAQECDFEELGQRAELLVRPQSQNVAAEHYREVRSKFYGVRGITALTPKIGVLGPVMGGTLPIMNYTTLALTFLNQRVREIDMSGFASGYNAFDNLIKHKQLKGEALNSYVETMSKTVLNSITEKPVDILICMAQAPITPDTLIELRKRGVITVLWFVEDYLRFTTWQVMAPYYDFIFTIQRDACIDAIKGAGCPEVHYLPTAVDPMVHAPRNLSPGEMQRWGSDVSFLGAGYHNRQQMFASLANYDFKIWGTEWPGSKPFDRLVQEDGRRLKPDEYVNIFNASKINLNLHSSTERDGVDPTGDFLNPRTFELAGCGAFQLVDHRSLLDEVFTPGEDIITFEDTKDLKQKIDYYLAHEEERRVLAEASRKTVLEKHTYQHRLRDMLSIIYASRFDQLQARQQENPWHRIIKAADKFPELEERCKTAFARGEEPTLDALVADIVTGQGGLSDVEMKLLFLFHVSKQMIRMKREELGETK